MRTVEFVVVLIWRYGWLFPFVGERNDGFFLDFLSHIPLIDLIN